MNIKLLKSVSPIRNRPCVRAPGAWVRWILICTIATCPVRAAVIEVDSLVDDVDTNGNCTLREAVIAANNDTAIDACPAGGGEDAIILSVGTYRLTIPGSDENAAAAGDLDIASDLIVVGAGAAKTFIDADGIDRVFHIDPAGIGLDVVIGRMSVQGGSADGGGAIYQSGDTRAVLFAMSVTGSDAGDGFGGGIYHGDGLLALVGDTFSNNTANAGGGVFVARGARSVFLDCVIDQNDATASAGGIANDGDLEMTACTLEGNSALSGIGGALLNSGIATIHNSTISGNTSAIEGGGLYNAPNGQVELLNVTLVQNSAPSVGGVSNESTVTVGHSILAENSNDNCGGNIVATRGYNLEDADDCQFNGANDMSSIVKTPALLEALQANGGFGATHALQPASPAIDAGDATKCLQTDQRGTSRPQDGDGDGQADCDIGAFEASFDPNTMADLSVRVADSPDPVTAGSNVTYIVTATNSGPGEASTVILNVDIPANVAFVSSNIPQVSCDTPTPTTMLCQLGTLAAAGQVQGSVVVSTSAAGSISVSGSISGDQLDPAPLDNDFNVTTTVNAPVKRFKGGGAIEWWLLLAMSAAMAIRLGSGIRLR